MFEDLFKKRFTIDRIARIVLIVSIIFLIFRGLGAIGTILIPFALAWMIAYLLMPIINFLEKKLKIRPRALSIFIVVLLMSGILVGVISLLVPSIINESKKAWELVQHYDIGGFLLGLFPEELKTKSDFFKSIEDLIASINIQEFISYIQEAFSRSWKLLQNTLSYLSGLLVILLFFTYLIFIMHDYETLVKGFFELFPKSTRPYVHEVVDNIDFYINSYFKGQSLISLICGIILATGYAIMGLPLGITFGLFMGVLNMVPYLQYAGYPILVMLVGLQSAATGENFFILLLIGIAISILADAVQQVILVPTIQGKSMGMKPAIILLSLTLWGSIFGLLGLLFALPLTMILYTFYMKYVIGEPIDNEATVRDETRKDIKSLFHRRKKK